MCWWQRPNAGSAKLTDRFAKRGFLVLQAQIVAA